MAGITGTGYQQAFEQAQKQFNTEQDRANAKRQELTNATALMLLTLCKTLV
jgi:hypothetical protein